MICPAAVPLAGLGRERLRLNRELRGRSMTDRLGIAVEVGGGHTTCALVDGSRVLDRTLVDGDSTSLVRTLETVEVCVRTLLAAAGVEPEDCIGVSVAFCGIVDAGNGRVLATPHGKFEDAIELDLAGWSRD